MKNDSIDTAEGLQSKNMKPSSGKSSAGTMASYGSGSESPQRSQEDQMADLYRETNAAYQPLEVVAVNPDEGSTAPEYFRSGEGKSVKVFCHSCQQKLDVTKLRPFSRISCPSCSESLLVPKWFDNYLLEEPCGHGGMAQVYRALDIALDREVAIKILRDEIRHDSVQAKRFLREARMAAVLNHSAVIPIYTCGTWCNQTYMVMQYMTGTSLENKFNAEKGHFSDLNQVLNWFHDVAEALEHAAGHAIVHHDVKPGNILLDGDGNVKIGDFGLAQSSANTEDDSEIPDEEWVTPYYVSPERISSGKEDFRGDIYSLGATFYHLLTGKIPFEHENLEELIWMRTREMPVEPVLRRKDLPRKISSLIMEMMQIDPASRPSYRRIITVLEEVLNNGEDGPMVLQRDIPLPKVENRANGGSGGLPSGILRVKSPSAVLKNRKNNEGESPSLPGFSLDDNDEGTEGRDFLGKKTADLSKETFSSLLRNRNFWLLAGLGVLTILVCLFLTYATVELLRAGL